MDEIKLSFGDGANHTTFANVFGHLTRGYTVDINDVSVQVNTVQQHGVTGLGGYTWTPDDIDQDQPPSIPIFVPWEEIESVVIW